MKSRALFLVALLSFVCLTIPFGLGLQSHGITISSQGAIRYSTLTWLHTDGKYIKNESNQTVFLRGAAFGGLETYTYWQGGYDFLVYRMNQFFLLTDGKPTVIRVPITPYPKSTDTQYKFPNLPTIYNEAVDQIVRLAEQKNIYLVLEFHGGCSQSECTRLGQDPTDWINWWLHWVNRYKNNPIVCGFEIWNEPWDANFGGGDSSLGRQRWLNIATQCYQAIKAANPKALVFVASASSFNFIDQYWRENPLGEGAVYTWDIYYKNFAYDWIPICYDTGDFEEGKRRLEDFLGRVCGIRTTSADYNLPVLGSEFSWSGEETNNWDVEMADELSLLNDWETHWYIWWWWANPNNYGMANADYTALSPQGEIWAEYLGHTPSA